MRILVIGGGGREHALVWKLSQSPLVTQLWCAPGNGGISDECECIPVDTGDANAVAELAQQLHADLTVIGPELPLVRGVADEFAKRGMALLGPSRAAAELEGSKVFAKEFMQRHGIPTSATIGVFTTRDEAEQSLANIKWPAVIKADGLCAGKGVLVAKNREEASKFLDRLMVQREFGEGAARVLIEEAISGPELSVIVLTDGKRTVEMAPARDYKRAFDGGAGPNTGGMGAISSDELLPSELAKQIRETIIGPTIHGMEKDGRAYRGFLYFGLMLTAKGPMVLEYNCRLGDPETEAIILRMGFDLARALASCAAGELDPAATRWHRLASACVVMTAGGYPGEFRKGDKIEGLETVATLSPAKVFHAGTRKEGAAYYTSGGRMLAVTALGATIHEAARNVYDTISKIHIEGEHHRTDIGAEATSRGTAADSTEHTPNPPRFAAGG
jgi:phosphoribosylamine---glycine ligase